MPGPAYPAVENYRYDWTAQHLVLSEDGSRASARFACIAEVTHALEGGGTFVEMARLQGNGPLRLSDARSFVGNYVKTAEGWAIERIELA